MNPIVCHFANGRAFFTGVGFVVVSVVLVWLPESSAFRRLSLFVACVGSLIVALSAAPIPGWFYAMWVVALVTWQIIERVGGSAPRRMAGILRIAVILICAAATLAESPFHVTRSPRPARRRLLYVIGDSITAGIGRNVKAWPTLLAEKHALEVIDLSRAGEKLDTAFTNVDRVSEADALVLMEIGGNDMLERKPVAQFENELERLCKVVAQQNRRVALMELPLPPLHNGYGHAQRRIAKECGATLIPKRHFVSVLAGEGNTTDGLHLSQKGQEAMAELLWQIVGPSLDASVQDVQSVATKAESL